MPHKILITGTLRSGKTTLLNGLQNRPQFAIVPEVAQSFIKKYGYGITQEARFQDMVFAEQLRREELGVQLGKPYILCDRGTLDNIAFCQVIGVPIKPEWLELLHDRY